MIEVRKPTNEEMLMAKTWPIWTKEISEFPWSYENQETCHIINGKAEVTPHGGEPIAFGAGDWVVFPEGLSCTWNIIEPIEKRYQFGG